MAESLSLRPGIDGYVLVAETNQDTSVNIDGDPLPQRVSEHDGKTRRAKIKTNYRKEVVEGGEVSRAANIPRILVFDTVGLRESGLDEDSIKKRVDYRRDLGWLVVTTDDLNAHNSEREGVFLDMSKPADENGKPYSETRVVRDYDFSASTVADESGLEKTYISGSREKLLALAGLLATETTDKPSEAAAEELPDNVLPFDRAA